FNYKQYTILSFIYIILLIYICSLLFISIQVRSQPCFTLFPYTTLFRSRRGGGGIGLPPGPGCADPHHRGRRRAGRPGRAGPGQRDRKSTRLNSSHVSNSYAVFCMKKKKIISQSYKKY